MTDPLSPLSRYSRSAALDKAPALDKADPRAAGASPLAAAPVQVRPVGLGDDRLDLSEVARAAMKDPGFDRAKVDAIKDALQNGQYPLDARRIAENFVAIEKMIKG